MNNQENNQENHTIEHEYLSIILKNESDICNDPDLHDGSYELVRKTIEFLSNIDSSKYDVKDMDMLYLMTIGTWDCGWDCKEKWIKRSNLKQENKIALVKILNNIKSKAIEGYYNNSNYNESIGMFSKGFTKFRSLTDGDARKFVKLCVDIENMDNKDEIFEKFENFLSVGIKGLGAASVSQILHCLKPFLFPIINNAMGNEVKIYNMLGIELKNPKSETTYIYNSKIIEKIRDENFSFIENYRAFDLLNFTFNDYPKNVWLLSPGEKGIYWDEFRENNFIAIGWGNLGDLSKYENNKEKLFKDLERKYPKNSETYMATDSNKESKQINNAKALCDFYKEINIGDIVFVKKGKSTLLGVGIVTSDYAFLNESIILDRGFNHVRDVIWLKCGDFDVSSVPIVTKTLTNITDINDENFKGSEYYHVLAKIMDFPIDYFIKRNEGLGELSEGEKKLLKIANNDMIEIYKQIKWEILNWDNNIVIGTTKHYISFKLNTIFATLWIKKDKINVWIYLKKYKYLKDPKKFAKHSKPTIGTIEHDKENYSFYMQSDNDIDYSLDLIKQSCDDNKESNNTDRKIWRIYPTRIEPKENFDKHWELYKKESIVGIGWLPHVNLNDFETKEEIKEANIKIHNMSQRSTGHNQVWDFVHSINIGDFIIVSGRKNEICGIGIIESDYIPPDENWVIGENINDDVDYFQIRKVKWIKTERKDLSFDYKRNNNVTLEEIKDLKIWDKIKKEYCDDRSIVMKGINRIYYGAPGTGKSYQVNQDFPNFERVTFHPEYTYFDFVGGLKPVVDENENISYEFVPGPFTNVLVDAYKNKTFNNSFNYEIDENNLKIGVFPEEGKEYEILFEKYCDIFRNAGFKTNNEILKNWFNGDLKKYSENWSSWILGDDENLDAFTEIITLFYNYVFTKVPDFFDLPSNEGIEIDLENSLKDQDLRSKFFNIAKSHKSNISNFWLNKLYRLSLINYIHGEKVILDRKYRAEVKKLFDNHFGRKTEKTITKKENIEKYGLIIEEINRANTAAVFGDIFQLLDRDSTGRSEYPINNIDLIKHLRRELNDNSISEIIIPPNFSLIATMNSADQGVFVMDSAFKRRWEFVYTPIDFKSCEYGNTVIEGFDIPWAEFGEKLNKKLSKLGVPEDKLIGPYFLKEKDINEVYKVASKLLIYLWDDVVRYKRFELFNKEFYQFSDVVNAFSDNKPIFVKSLQDKLYESKPNDTEENSNDEASENIPSLETDN